MATEEKPKQKRQTTTRLSKNASEELKNLIAAARKLKFEEKSDLQKAIIKMIQEGKEAQKNKLIQDLKKLGYNEVTVK
ncbi:MAG: hypothetical protein ACOXZV_06030 [Bacteroidales bacterium]|jgi:3-oxoacyl-ACP reductase-like protein